MKKSTIRYGIVACMAAMVIAVVYAFVRLYVLNTRVDLSIFAVNIVAFSASAAALVYLSWKQKEIEEEELFRD
jgi:hypothetical protein